jgi:superfamily II DNA helicase RecQ
VDFIQNDHRGKSGIVYCRKVETCNELATLLSEKGVVAAAYHSKVSSKRRTQTLADWELGKIPVVVCTIAFGMGIDKGSIRFVVHWDLPKSTEGFYQEYVRGSDRVCVCVCALCVADWDIACCVYCTHYASDTLQPPTHTQPSTHTHPHLCRSGRAGRDGRESVSLMYFSEDEMRTQQFLMNKTLAEANEERVAAARASFQVIAHYCRSITCRRARLLSFFGEPTPTHSGAAAPPARTSTSPSSGSSGSSGSTPSSRGFGGSTPFSSGSRGSTSASRSAGEHEFLCCDACVYPGIVRERVRALRGRSSRDGRARGSRGSTRVVDSTR